MKTWHKLVLAFAIMVGGMTVATAALPATQAQAINVFKDCTNKDLKNSEVCKSKKDNLDSPVKVIVNVLLWAIGILSVIMIIFGGIRYVVSSGDSSKVKAAKDTILYAIIGLIVAILSWTIVNYVVTQFN